MFGEALWEELGRHGVDVLVCAAGATLTPNFEQQTPASRRGMARPLPPEAVVAEAIEATKKDIAEVRAGLAKQSMAESMACSEVHRRLPTVKPADPALAADAVQVCDYERPLSELAWTISQVEAEIEENAKRPNPHNLKRQLMGCATPTAKSARETMEAAGKLDDAAKTKFARFDELCPAE